MPTPDPRIDAYVAQAEPFAQPILKHLRTLVHQSVPGLEETIRWRLPTFLHNGQQLCNIGSFKAHCSLVVAPRTMEPILTADGHTGESGMGQFGKITALQDLPSNAQLKRYFQLAAQHISAPPVAKKATVSDKTKIATPPDLTAALKLKQHAKSATTWQSLTPGKQRDYNEWITDAKRDETRARRLATTLEWLAEGKARHWKYENC